MGGTGGWILVAKEGVVLSPINLDSLLATVWNCRSEGRRVAGVLSARAGSNSANCIIGF